MSANPPVSRDVRNNMYDSNIVPNTTNLKNQTAIVTMTTEKDSPIPEDSRKPPVAPQHGGQGKIQQVPLPQPNQRTAPIASDASGPPPQPDISTSDLGMRVMEAERSLDAEKRRHHEERALHFKAMSSLQAKLKYMEQHLEVERDRHQQTKLDLMDKQKDADYQRQLKLEAVGELNRFLRGNKVSNQSADDEIIQKAMTLRISIRDFALLYFEGSIDQSAISPKSLEALNEYLRIPPDYLTNYITTASTRVNVVRAFIWAYLCENVFNRFSWTWQGAGIAFHDMCGFLDVLVGEPGNRDSQGLRKFHTWRANTAGLLAEAMSLDEATANSDCQQLIKQWSNHISQLIRPFRTSRDQEYRQGLESIIFQSVELDREICKQVAQMQWTIHDDLPCTFDPRSMEVELGQEQNSNNGVVTLVLGPGLVKRGKSSGDRFDLKERLLKTQVFYDSSSGDVAEETVPQESQEPQEPRKRLAGVKGKLQAYRQRIGDALAAEHNENPARQ
ncbi:hypothetical protein F4777DRAFT_569798 [Nemania sp. FL0916]|nr:hypothetical protein F4777DRAFT_569798 [Nemania sp. FL0916]